MSKAQSVKPPAGLTDGAEARWRVVAPGIIRRGHADRVLLATYCKVWARWKQAEDGIAQSGQLVRNAQGREVASPLIKIATQAASQVRGLEEQLGILEGAQVDRSALLTRRQLASTLAVHMQTVTKWEQDGLPIAKRGRKGKPSRYRESEVRAWLQARDEAAKRHDVDLTRDRSRRERAQALLLEQTHALRARDLLQRTEVEKVWGAEVAAIRALILSSYSTKADQLHRVATLEGVPGVERFLKDLAHEVLRELARPDRPPHEQAQAGAVELTA